MVGALCVDDCCRLTDGACIAAGLVASSESDNRRPPTFTWETCNPLSTLRRRISLLSSGRVIEPVRERIRDEERGRLFTEGATERPIGRWMMEILSSSLISIWERACCKFRIYANLFDDCKLRTFNRCSVSASFCLSSTAFLGGGSGLRRSVKIMHTDIISA